MNRYIFLDIDGVLNSHEKHLNGYCGTRPDCVAYLNEIIHKTDAKLVITSAWRYTVLMRHSTIIGFQNLLLTHGVNCHNRIVGVTEFDHHANNRGELISRWLARNTFGMYRYVVIDDGSNEDDGTKDDGMGIAMLHPHAFVRTNSLSGLTLKEAHQAIQILMEYQT
jgi:hypothetical protein